MLGREIIERQQRVAVLGEAFNRPAVLGAVFLGEDVDRHFGGRPVRRPVDFAQILLHVACTESGTLSRTFTVLCTQQRWCRVPGKTSSSAFQKPSAPSPTAISGAICNPRCFTSIRSSRQLCALSRTPT